MEILCQRLKKSRKEAGLTHKDLAERLYCAASTISSYETGRNSPHVDVLVQLCEVLNVSADYLLGLTDTSASSDSITEYTGLTLDIIEKLHFLNSVDGLIERVEGYINSLCAEVESERIDTIIGTNIKAERTKQGYSLEQMSNAIGVSISAVHAYETGVRHVKLTNMLKIARFLQKDVSWFSCLHIEE